MITFLILAAAIGIYFKTEDAIWATVFSIVFMSVFILMFNGIGFSSLIAIAIYGLLTFGYFSLLDQTYETSWYWPSIIGGYFILSSGTFFL